MIDIVFSFFSTYLIEVMSTLLVSGLLFRWTAFRLSKSEDKYFSTFTNEVDKILSNGKFMEKYQQEDKQVKDVEKFLDDLLFEVQEKLPNRSIRNSKKKKKEKKPNLAHAKKAESLGAANVVSLRDFVGGERALFISIKNESGAFRSSFPPNYNELTSRILAHDDQWNKLLNFFPIGPLSRLNDIMPGLFVVFGIFGTFVGINMALPEIAKIDFNNLDGSGEILTRFVLSVTFAMKTSIAGILFSLLMTFLNTLAPVSGLRNRTFKMIANCFENIWINIHASKSANAQMQEVLPGLLEEMKTLRSDFQKVNKAVLDDEDIKKGA